MQTTQAVVKFKPGESSGLNGIRAHDLCDTGAVLYQLSYQAIWELVTLWVRIIPIEGFNCGERYEFMIDHCSYTHNLSSREVKAWKNS